MRRVSSSFGLRTVRAGAGCLLGLATAACAIVEERRTDGTIDRSIVVGSPVILARPSLDRDTAIKASGLGLAVTNGATSLGWFDSSVVALDPGCHVILVEATYETLQKFAELTGGAQNVCDANIDKGGKK